MNRPVLYDRIKTDKWKKKPGEISRQETPKGIRNSQVKGPVLDRLWRAICTKEAILKRENLSGKKTEAGKRFSCLFQRKGE